MEEQTEGKPIVPSGVNTGRGLTSIFSEKISPANDGLFVLDGLFVHEGLYVYVQLTYKKAWIF